MQTGAHALEMKQPPLVADNKRPVLKIDTHTFNTARSFSGFLIAVTGRDSPHQGRARPHKIILDHNSDMGLV